MKKVLYVVGAGLVVGAVAATLYCMNNKKKKVSEETCEHKKFDDKFETENSESSKDIIIAQDEPVYEDVKRSMYSRHEGAATVMKDSVDTIRENIKVSEKTNDEIDEISSELDKMISED
ncbi:MULTISPECIES: hypothetical protein [Massilimicrobiota]|uniref:hypothetical protein n=1 Tax=Massilimicrobiota TaxID=1924110 RepID=UPI000B38C69C|nr:MULTISPECIES: hypothetical protein [Massilimicrobiota]OUQ25676.1 hypothetical protein B5E79_11815 [Massilimicrobiota sp. An134]